MINKFDSARFNSYSLNKNQHAEFIKQILASTFDFINPYSVVKKYLQENKIFTAKKAFAFGLGKAAISMTQAIADEIPLTDSLVITKHASFDGTSTRLSASLQFGSVILGNHPIPAAESLRAGVEAKRFLSQLTKDDLLICLISGGGSALMTSPVIPLDELQEITTALLKSGASIDEINTIRRHLDELKGGGVVQFASGAKIVSLILSDVVSDWLATIASGITAPDSSTKEDAIKILEKYEVKNKISTWKETLKANNSLFSNVENNILASNSTAFEFARSQIGVLWSQSACRLINKNLQGEASEVGIELALQFKSELQTRPRPFCLLAGGETTVTVKGNGKGGRNQELALSAVEILAGLDNIFFISIATDGEDGPTDAAGAVVTGESYQRSKKLGMDIANYKSRNDAYEFFNQLDDLIKTNPSGTNVNDLVFCFAF
jgi:hydroxypyruvate reductase